jgi:hypothetical protein
MIDFVDKISGLHGLLESTKNSKWDIPAEDAYAIAEVNTATEGVLLKTNDADSMEVVKLKQGDKLIILGIIPQESEYNR